MISDSSTSKISEFDLWKKIDGKQDVKGYLRSLRRIVEDLVADLGYLNLQHLHFEYKEIDGERVFGAANGGIWWQITVRQIGAGLQSVMDEKRHLWTKNVILWTKTVTSG